MKTIKSFHHIVPDAEHFFKRKFIQKFQMEKVYNNVKNSIL